MGSLEDFIKKYKVPDYWGIPKEDEVKGMADGLANTLATYGSQRFGNVHVKSREIREKVEGIDERLRDLGMRVVALHAYMSKDRMEPEVGLLLSEIPAQAGNRFGAVEIETRVSILSFLYKSPDDLVDAIRREYPHDFVPQKKTFEVELSGPLIGVRGLKYVDGEFSSVVKYHTMKTIWGKGPVTASCMSLNSHHPPYQGCGCGLYAFYSYDHLMQYGSDLSGTNFLRVVVKGFGDIIECDSGFRSEKMSLLGVLYDEKEVDVYGQKINLLSAYESVADKLGVPVMEIEDIPEFAYNMGAVYRGADAIESETDNRSWFQRLIDEGGS